MKIRPTSIKLLGFSYILAPVVCLLGWAMVDAGINSHSFESQTAVLNAATELQKVVLGYLNSFGSTREMLEYFLILPAAGLGVLFLRRMGLALLVSANAWTAYYNYHVWKTRPDLVSKETVGVLICLNAAVLLWFLKPSIFKFYFTRTESKFSFAPLWTALSAMRPRFRMPKLPSMPKVPQLPKLPSLPAIKLKKPTLLQPKKVKLSWNWFKEKGYAVHFEGRVVRIEDPALTERIPCLIETLSKGKIFIRTNERMHPGEMILIKFKVEKLLLEGRAKIGRCDPDYGYELKTYERKLGANLRHLMKALSLLGYKKTLLGEDAPVRMAQPARRKDDRASQVISPRKVA